MKAFSNVVSCCFSRLTRTRKFTSASSPRPTTPIVNTSTAPIADALESSPDYLNPSPLNKALPRLPEPTQPTPIIVKAFETEYPLFDMNRLDIEPEDRAWFRAVNIAVRKQMNTLGASHNYQHIRRVVSNAAYILKEEKKHHQWARDLDPMVVWITCMTHDIGDTKYQTNNKQHSQSDMVKEFLSVLDCPSHIRRQAAYLAPRVSFTKEISDEADAKAFADTYPVLRIVQDADRLDDLGAIGVSRLFVYGGVDEVRRNGPIGSGIELIDGRFREYPRLMKTHTGRKIAKERYGWMEMDFVPRWKAEADTSNV